MALTWAGVITILFLAAACVRGYRRGLIDEGSTVTASDAMIVPTVFPQYFLFPILSEKIFAENTKYLQENNPPFLQNIFSLLRHQARYLW